MDRLLLHRLDLQRFKLLVKYLAQVHNNAFVNLLPQMGTEDLNQVDLQRRYLAVHENSRQIQLDLEADIDIGAIDRWAPPQSEITIRDLVLTGSLRI